MGVEVGATSVVVEKVARSGLSPREQAYFIGWLTMAAHGQGWDVVSHTTLAKFRRLTRELSISLDGLAEDEAGGFLSHLDWETGRQEFRVA